MAVAVAVLLTALVAILDYHQHRHLEAEILEQGRHAEALFWRTLDGQARRLQNRLDTIGHQKGLTEALRAADRDVLQARAAPLFERRLAGLHVSELTFLRPNGVSILRVNDPQRYGDTVRRYSLNEAARSGQVVSGLELDAAGHVALRSVAPWHDGENVIALVDLAQDVAPTLQESAQILGVGLVLDVGGHPIRRGHGARGKPGIAVSWNRIEPGQSTVTALQGLPPDLVNAVLRVPDDDGASGLGIELDGRLYGGVGLPLDGLGGQPLGRLLVLKDLTHDAAAGRQAILQVTAVGALVSFLLLGFYFVVARSAGGALERSRRDLVEVRETLERRVAERTDELAQANQRLQAEVEERRRAEEALRLSETRSRKLVEHANSIIMRRDLHGRVTYLNRFAEAFFGYTQEEIVGQSIIGTIVPKTDSTGRDLTAIIDDISRRPEAYVTNENESIRRNGQRVWIAWTNKAVTDASGKVVEILSIGHDVTRRRQIEEELRLMASVFRHSVEGIVITDAQGHIVRVNKGFCDITGYTEREVRGEHYRMLTSDSEDRMFHDNMWHILEKAGFWQGELWSRRKNGEVFPQWLGISAVRDGEGRVRNHIAVFTDMTEKKLTEKRIYRLAHYDALTDLPNRVLFQDRLEHALTQAHRNGSQVALLYLDLDRFKPINDTLGHHVGDLLLKAVADRLRSSVRESDTVTRMGGDEFTVIVPGIEQSRDIVPTASAIAHKIVKRLSHPFTLEGHEVFVTPSLGIACYPQDARTSPDLVKNADSAMYHAKQQGGQMHLFYEQRMNTAVAERMLLEHSLRKALERGEFRLYYQPCLSLRDGIIRQVEALLRWQHPELGMVLPDQFVPLAEETGLIVPIGEWVLHEACRQMKAWDEEGLPPLRVAVNVSLRQLRDKRLVDATRRLLAETGLESGRLALEITESTFMEDVRDTVSVLDELSGTGVHLLIDDFGSGYSSLGHLRRFPVDSVKIDRSFVRDIVDDPHDAAIISAIIAMAHQLRLGVIAEGVESDEQLSFLRSHRCDVIQGFLVSEPLSPTDCVEVCSGWSAPRPQNQLAI